MSMVTAWAEAGGAPGRAGGAAEAAGGEGITGIKGLASRELTYRLSFMACSVQARRPGRPRAALPPPPTASVPCTDGRRQPSPCQFAAAQQRKASTPALLCLKAHQGRTPVRRPTPQERQKKGKALSAACMSVRKSCARDDLLTARHGAQAADVKMGAINIRSDGASPDEVMAAFSRAEQEEVRALLSAPLAPERGRISPDLCHSHAPTHTTAPSTS